MPLYLFDLLHHGPDSLLGLPYTGRRERLEELGRLDADPVQTPPWYRDDAEIVLATSLQKRPAVSGVRCATRRRTCVNHC